MAYWLTPSVRNRILLAGVAGLLTAAGAYAVARWLKDDAAKAAANAALNALVVIVVGTVVAAVVDHRASRRAAQFQRSHRAAVRAQLLSRLGSNLKLAATGWVHRPGISRPDGEDLSLDAGPH